MTGREPGRSGAEATRVEAIYRGYAASPRRRRAWAADNPGNRAIRQELLDVLLDEARPELDTAGEVLEIGCGTGHWLSALSASGVSEHRLTGIDILASRVAEAAARLPAATITVGDARGLPFPSGRFRVVLVFTLLSSLRDATDVRSALGEAARVVDRRGVLLIYEPRLPSPVNRDTRRLRRSDLDFAGIEPRRDRTLTVFPSLARRLGRRAPMLYPLLARVPILRTHHLIVYRPSEV